MIFSLFLLVVLFGHPIFLNTSSYFVSLLFLDFHLQNEILKQISKDVKETARIQGNIDENVFLKYYEKLWNTTNIN